MSSKNAELSEIALIELDKQYKRHLNAFQKLENTDQFFKMFLLEFKLALEY